MYNVTDFVTSVNRKVTDFAVSTDHIICDKFSMENERLHRLKEIREELGLTQPDFAELLDSTDDPWYKQRVERLENDKTQLTAKDAHNIAKKLNRPVWHLFVDPILILDEFDRQLASRFRAAPEDVQINIKRQLGMLEMPVYPQAASDAMTLHERRQGKTDFELPEILKGKKK